MTFPRRRFRLASDVGETAEWNREAAIFAYPAAAGFRRIGSTAIRERLPSGARCDCTQRTYLGSAPKGTPSF